MQTDTDPRTEDTSGHVATGGWMALFLALAACYFVARWGQPFVAVMAVAAWLCGLTCLMLLNLASRFRRIPAWAQGLLGAAVGGAVTYAALVGWFIWAFRDYQF